MDCIGILGADLNGIRFLSMFLRPYLRGGENKILSDFGGRFDSVPLCMVKAMSKLRKETRATVGFGLGLLTLLLTLCAARVALSV